MTKTDSKVQEALGNKYKPEEDYSADIEVKPNS